MTLSRTQRFQVNSETLVDKVKIKPLEVKLFQASDNKACMVIPKKHIKKACDRNKVRRSCLEFVRKTFKNRQLGAIMIRVYTSPDDLETISDILSQCINQLRC